MEEGTIAVIVILSLLCVSVMVGGYYMFRKTKKLETYIEKL